MHAYMTCVLAQSCLTVLETHYNLVVVVVVVFVVIVWTLQYRAASQVASPLTMEICQKESFGKDTKLCTASLALPQLASRATDGAVRVREYVDELPTHQPNHIALGK
jgi:hypothetical protein